MLAVEKEVNCCNYTKKQKAQVRENIWHKLFYLQNYNVTKDMFLGSYLRWTSIQCYMSLIRRIYLGEIDEFYDKSVVTPALIKYIQNLVDSGEEPLPKLDINNGEISIEDLTKAGVLTKHEISYIYNNVGPDNNQPDISVSSFRNKHNVKSFERYNQEYATIVHEYSTNTIVDKKYKVNPVNNLTYHDVKNFIPLKLTLPIWVRKLKQTL